MNRAFVVLVEVVACVALSAMCLFGVRALRVAEMHAALAVGWPLVEWVAAPLFVLLYATGAVAVLVLLLVGCVLRRWSESAPESGRSVGEPVARFFVL